MQTWTEEENDVQEVKQIQSNVYDDSVEITFEDDVTDNNGEVMGEEDFEDDALVDEQIHNIIESDEEDHEFRRIQGH